MSEHQTFANTVRSGASIATPQAGCYLAQIGKLRRQRRTAKRSV
jgi:hypothetical protein